ncbi:biotin synthase BioB [Clostridium cylindrosporum]|uniref:Biotin synthase n=1 Tax=Clostridium cylindrosporum DSM 605 TaxID=1121307 RepID=A0A0J8D472_CLOCY|nr:biotin synthase BioB [Clostridium cylindrosporum]KMT20980.1 biotin synthase BioB [Clostridium cylindrosporum DSM 605]
MEMLKSLKRDILNGYSITRQEAISLYKLPLESLVTTANEIREKMCGDSFDMCTIINGKSGRCSENCKYCAQSSFYKTNIDEYPLLEAKKIVDAAEKNHLGGVLRFSIVTSGRSLNDEEINSVCESYKDIGKKCGISLCASHGLLSLEQFKKLKEAGVTRYHNNLETSRRFFEKICTTHTYDEKIEAIKRAQQAGLEVCSGGILGLGEDIEDRIDMVMDIKALGIKSLPVNILNPIPGTPLENASKLSQEEIIKSISIFRFIMPDGAIRLAGGRALLEDMGRKAFLSGANAAISGDMLTTLGISLKDDIDMITSCGYKVKKI